MHRRETARACAAEQTQQKRLGLIVARVAERNEVGAAFPSRALEMFVARRTRGVLRRFSRKSTR